MLDLLRRKAQSPYLQATVVIIILVFVFWGVGTNQGNGRNTIATVDDQSISYMEFDQALERTIDQYKDQFGGSLPADFVETFGLKRQVLDQLIQQALIRKGAIDMELYVSNEEVQDDIKTMGVFLNNGVFDVDRYNEVLRSSRLTPKKYEKSVRIDLLGRKATGQVTSFGHVLDSELLSWFRYENEERQLEYVVFKAGDFQDQLEESEEKLAVFFEEHQDDYRTLPQVKLKYISFLFKDEIDKLTIDEAELESYYQQHLDQYSQPETRRARHILLKSENNDSEKVEQKMQGILARARGGEDFTKLAEEFSEDSTAAKGGDLGFFGRGQMVETFEDTAFGLKEGEISDIVRSRFGFHIIKLEEIRPATTQTFAEVRESIKNKLTQEKGKTETFKTANATYEKIILSGSLEKYAESGEIPIVETDFFNKNSPPAEISGDRSLINVAFSLKKGELSSLIESSKGYFIVFIDDSQGPVVPPIADVKEAVTADFLAAGSLDLASQAAEKLLTAGREGDFQTVCQEQGVSRLESGFFSRAKQTDKDLPAPVLRDAFQLTEKQPFPKEVKAEGNSFYVFRLKEVKNPSDDEFAKVREELKKRIERENQINIMSAWMEHLKSSAKISINKKFL